MSIESRKMRKNRVLGIVVLGIVSIAAMAASTVTSVANVQPAIKAASTSGVSFTVDAYRQYTLVHTGKDAAGSDATGLVCIGIDTAPAAADYSEDNNKLVLPAGSAVIVGPFAGRVYLKSASGAPMVQIIPSGRW